MKKAVILNRVFIFVLFFILAVTLFSTMFITGDHNIRISEIDIDIEKLKIENYVLATEIKDLENKVNLLQISIDEVETYQNDLTGAWDEIDRINDDKARIWECLEEYNRRAS